MKPMKTLEKEFEEILENRKLYTLFQPIVDLKNGEITGYEVFNRGPEGSDFHSPIELLKMAKKLNRTWDLEVAFRTTAFWNARGHLNGKLLFLNVDPSVIDDEKFREGFTKIQLEVMNINPRNVVFEVTEQTVILDYEKFKKIHNHYKKQGYYTAVDNVGAVYTGLKSISETKPSFIKIDRQLILGIDKNKHKQTMVKSFVQLSQTNDVKIIAVGVETKEELITIISLGVHYGQGSFFCVPQASLIKSCDNIKMEVFKTIKESRHNNIFDQDTHYISSLIKRMPTIDKDTICEEVEKYFEKYNCKSLTVVEGTTPLGLMSKSKFDSHLSSRYGYSLYCKKPINALLEENSLILDAYTPIYTAGQLALKRADVNQYDDIIVTDKKIYIGVVSMNSIIDYTINYERDRAKELNPLTSLPGNISISKSLNNIILSNSNCGVFYVDIDNFKVYNDIYGFEAGDNVISLVASMLNKSVKAKYPTKSFLGHVGGDDFIFVIEASNEEYYSICKEIITEFDNQIKYYFKLEDLELGYLEAEDRFNEKRRFPLTSVTIAGIYGYLAKFSSETELVEMCASIKVKAKKMQGSNYVIKEIVANEVNIRGNLAT